ncbi:MAG TPA: alanine--glyoxylate aminotransferase family protein [Candidatus Eisenbacteria bacterium]|nr:alanine--glyoxylate aminotransferase family protein [Candidatus Eisenbacteria bacterium]
MSEKLFTPGPVEIPARVLQALGQRPPHHRSESFRALYGDVSVRLARLFDTQGVAVILAASGTGGLESAVVSLVRRGERVLVGSSGKFGERWSKILSAYGHAHEVVKAEYGKPVDPAAWAVAVARLQPGIVFFTHSETSTGTLNDARALAASARQAGALVVADCVTSLGVHALRQDEDQIDVAVGGSQKGLMLPPGLAVLGVGARALERLESATAAGPSFYLDLAKAAASARQSDTPFTPAVSLVLALDESLRMIEEIGIQEVWRRHAALARAIREGAGAAGYRLFSSAPADSVTALLPPDGVDPSAVVKHVRSMHHLVLTGGQDSLKGKIVRVGHMGLAYGPEDAVLVSRALEDAAMTLGATGRSGSAAEVAQRALESAT